VWKKKSAYNGLTAVRDRKKEKDTGERQIWKVNL
jgi:hypothetical protein